MRDELHPNVFREVNERIAEITKTWRWDDPQGYLCECADGRCTETVWLTRAQYESVRDAPSRFLTAPGHEPAGGSRVVERHAAFVVVETPDGDGGAHRRASSPAARRPSAAAVRAAHRPRP
jgi:hypothetical protein